MALTVIPKSGLSFTNLILLMVSIAGLVGAIIALAETFFTHMFDKALSICSVVAFGVLIVYSLCGMGAAGRPMKGSLTFLTLLSLLVFILLSILGGFMTSYYAKLQDIENVAMFSITRSQVNIESSDALSEFDDVRADFFDMYREGQCVGGGLSTPQPPTVPLPPPTSWAPVVCNDGGIQGEINDSSNVPQTIFDYAAWRACMAENGLTTPEAQVDPMVGSWCRANNDVIDQIESMAFWLMLGIWISDGLLLLSMLWALVLNKTRDRDMARPVREVPASTAAGGRKEEVQGRPAYRAA
jgi:hypothetical protein